jgi:tetratricopeptide (TPR) repeat protein
MAWPALLACQSLVPVASEPDEVHLLVASGQYAAAVELAQARASADPNNAHARDEHRLASVAFLLNKGREWSFGEWSFEGDEGDEGGDEIALELFEQARALSRSPESEGDSSTGGSGLFPTPDQPQQWIEKTRAKIAVRWMVRGERLLATGDLSDAGDAFGMAARYDPSLRGLEAAVASIDKRLEFHSDMAEDYYNAGIGHLQSGNLEVARSRFSYADKYSHGGQRAQERLGEVRSEIARRHVALAETLESTGFFSAARVEYLTAADSDPGNDEAQRGLERMHLEAQAFETLKRGEMWVLRREWERATEVLLAGREQTQMQEEAFDLVLLQLEDARTQESYDLAMNLEHDFRFFKAISQYERVLDGRDFYLDARTRLDILREKVERVEVLYESQGSEQDPDERLKLLRQIEFIWPDYKDIQALLEFGGA